MPMTRGTRYRAENGRSCIDIKIQHSRQLFDGRDPAPFHERALDDDAVAYLLGAAQEISWKQPLAIAVTISAEAQPSLPADVIVEAMHRHFAYEGEQVERRLREHLRRGQMTLGVGLTALVLFLTLAQLTASLTAGPLREILREGLVITGWVAMWRPLEILLYDWWPLVDERRQVRRILEAPVSVRYQEATVQPAGDGLPRDLRPPAPADALIRALELLPTSAGDGRAVLTPCSAALACEAPGACRSDVGTTDDYGRSDGAHRLPRLAIDP